MVFLFFILSLHSQCHYEYKDVLQGQDFETDLLTAQLSKLQSCGYINADPLLLAIDSKMTLATGFIYTYFPNPCGDNSGEKTGNDFDFCETISSVVLPSLHLFFLMAPETCDSYTRKDRGACLQALNLSPCEASADRQIAQLLFLEQRHCRPVEPTMLDPHHPLQGNPGFRKCRRDKRSFRHSILGAAYWNAANGFTRL